MGEMERMQLSEFSTVNKQRIYRSRLPVIRSLGAGNSKRAKAAHYDRWHPNTRGLLIKLGVCAGACALILGLKWINVPATNAAVDSIRRAMGEEEDISEIMGKLRFVELPGILEVFSGDGRYPLPIKAKSSSLSGDEQSMTLVSSCEQTASVSAEGRIRETGTSAEHGMYVILMAKGDIEIAYYGLESIAVEDGQLVYAGDDLGKVCEDAPFIIRVSESGAPVNPTARFETIKSI